MWPIFVTSRVSSVYFTMYFNSFVPRTRHNFLSICQVCFSRGLCRFLGSLCGLFARKSSFASSSLVHKRNPVLMAFYDSFGGTNKLSSGAKNSFWRQINPAMGQYNSVWRQINPAMGENNPAIGQMKISLSTLKISYGKPSITAM